MDSIGCTNFVRSVWLGTCAIRKPSGFIMRIMKFIMKFAGGEGT